MLKDLKEGRQNARINRETTRGCGWPAPLERECYHKMKRLCQNDDCHQLFSVAFRRLVLFLVETRTNNLLLFL